MAEHTPGPWELHENEDGDFEIHMGTRIGAFNSWQTQHVVEMRHSLAPDDGEQYDEALATANLIAAAPDLLAALEKAQALEDHELECEFCLNAPSCEIRNQMAADAGVAREDALAKAKGQQD